MTAPVAARWDVGNEDVLFLHREEHMTIHRPLQENSLVPSCAMGSKDKFQRMGRYAAEVLFARECTRAGCWPKGPGS